MHPTVEIVEQPMAKGQRFRYKCEGKSAGSLFGIRSTQIQKSFPSIKVHNHNGPAAIVISCVTKDPPYYPHPHNLVGQDCQDGVCTLKVKSCSSIISMTNVGVQCCKKQDIDQHLKERENIRVDPFGNIKDIKKEDIDLGVVRLCFQVFLPDANKKFTVSLRPIISDPIIDKKCIQDLVICRMSISGGTCYGGNEMFLLCEKINKDDIQVRFYEETTDGIAWEDYGIFKQSDVHRQCAIVLLTPAYKTQEITNPVTVLMQLRKPSDNSCGEPMPFQYFPCIKESRVDSTQLDESDCRALDGLFDFEPLLADSQIVSTTSLGTQEYSSLISNGDVGSSDQAIVVNRDLFKFLNVSVSALGEFGGHQPCAFQDNATESSRMHSVGITSTRKRPMENEESSNKIRRT